MWEHVAEQIKELGGEIHFNSKCTGVNIVNSDSSNHVSTVTIESTETKVKKEVEADWIFSTMPVKDLFNGINDKKLNKMTKDIATHLEYRDFITVGVLVNKLKIKNNTNINTLNDLVPDNWIYIQEKDVKVGRLQIFNNWSPYMVKDPINTVWLGMEYFVNEDDALWNKSESDMQDFAINELSMLGIIDKKDLLDTIVVKVPKAYPAYWGTYGDFGHVKDYINSIDNLYLVGRNGMHKYNNQDHSMLSSMVAVDNILGDIGDKSNVWLVNPEDEYHEETK
jgi:protoporphyrinogen oxidase